MNKDIVVYICGLHSLSFVIFHCAFWKLFKWQVELKKLGMVNRAIMQILNIQLICVFLLTAFLCIFYNSELHNTSLGKAFLAGMSIFWLIRAIEQMVFLPINNKYVHLLTVLFMAGCILFFLPLF